METLPMTALAAVAAAGLPMHHGDPFDRMLVAQALRRVSGWQDFDVVCAERGIAGHDEGAECLASRIHVDDPELVDLARTLVIAREIATPGPEVGEFAALKLPIGRRALRACPTPAC